MKETLFIRVLFGRTCTGSSENELDGGRWGLIHRE